MITGICDGMVMQRDKNDLCDIYFKCNDDLKNVRVSDKFSNPKLTKTNDTWHLTGIRTGGPYTLDIEEYHFDNIYVGDVWILAGQSNMQGIGRMLNIKPNCDREVRASYMDGHWDIANHPLHKLGEAKKKVHTEIYNEIVYNFSIKCVGPGLSFAKRMKELTAVPQGIIACAHGGTNLYEQWSPKHKDKGEHSLYGACLERFIENGGNCAGIFWYQGCSDASDTVNKRTSTQPAQDYAKNMIELVKSFREDFKANLPFIQVQISRKTWGGFSMKEDNTDNITWTMIREHQRTLHEKVDNLDTVHTIAYRLSDCIHLNAKSQETVGKDAAEAMYCLIYGEHYDCKPGIKLSKMRVYQDPHNPDMSSITIKYDNLKGGLDNNYRAMGFSIGENPQHWHDGGIYDVSCDGNVVTIWAEWSKENITGKYLWYGLGVDSCANILDQSGRSLPAFGPIKICDTDF